MKLVIGGAFQGKKILPKTPITSHPGPTAGTVTGRRFSVQEASFIFMNISAGCFPTAGIPPN